MRDMKDFKTWWRPAASALLVLGLSLVFGAAYGHTGRDAAERALETIRAHRPAPGPGRVIMADATGAGAKVSSDFAIEMTSGGGFTGMYQGHRITADGKVVKLRSGPNASKKAEEPLGSIDAAALARINDAVSQAKFFELSLDQPGNMTVVLTVTREGKRHSVRYPLPMDQHPEAVRPIVEAIKAVTKPLESSRPQPQ